MVCRPQKSQRWPSKVADRQKAVQSDISRPRFPMKASMGSPNACLAPKAATTLMVPGRIESCSPPLLSA